MTELKPIRSAEADRRGGQIVPAVLCGGAGSRLWPVSRRDFAKQHAAIMGGVSPFQRTIARLAGGAFADPIVRWNGETPPMIAACCLAKSRRDTGHSRDPDPPQRIAGMIAPARRPASGLRSGDRSVIFGSLRCYRPVRRAIAIGVRKSSAKSRGMLGFIT